MFMRLRILGSTALAVLTLCTLALTTLAGDRNPAARPFKVKGDFVFIVSQEPTTLGEAVGISEGQATHVGKFVAHTTGSFDFATGDFVGEGVLTAANGDLIYFKMRSLGWVEFTGGTGRFENVTGGHTIEPTAPPEQRNVDGQWTVIFSYTGEGTITYSNRPLHECKDSKVKKRRS
jgi:hypothetical protein